MKNNSNFKSQNSILKRKNSRTFKEDESINKE